MRSRACNRRSCASTTHRGRWQCTAIEGEPGRIRAHGPATGEKTETRVSQVPWDDQAVPHPDRHRAVPLRPALGCSRHRGHRDQRQIHAGPHAEPRLSRSELPRRYGLYRRCGQERPMGPPPFSTSTIPACVGQASTRPLAAWLPPSATESLPYRRSPRSCAEQIPMNACPGCWQVPRATGERDKRIAAQQIGFARFTRVGIPIPFDRLAPFRDRIKTVAQRGKFVVAHQPARDVVAVAIVGGDLLVRDRDGCGVYSHLAQYDTRRFSRRSIRQWMRIGLQVKPLHLKLAPSYAPCPLHNQTSC